MTSTTTTPEAPTTIVEDRYTRQRDLVPADRLAAHHPLVIGCGAVGSVVARQLAHMGCPRVSLVDFDTVDVVNLCCQGFREVDLGRPKVDAVADQMRQINSSIDIETRNQRAGKTMIGQHDVLFVCVDSIDVRKLVFEWSMLPGAVCRLLVDARVKGGEAIRICTVFDEPSNKRYRAEALFDSGETIQGSCTAKTTIYGAYISAGLMVAEYVYWLREFERFYSDYLINVPAQQIGEA